MMMTDAHARQALEAAVAATVDGYICTVYTSNLSSTHTMINCYFNLLRAVVRLHRFMSNASAGGLAGSRQRRLGTDNGPGLYL
jgi:hypothetical protein